jgi:hypothetical protein
MIRERAERIRRRYGLEQSDPQAEPELWPRSAQIDLFDQAT